MPPPARRRQLNVELSENDDLVLAQACAIDDVSRPELAREILAGYLSRRLHEDDALRQAVEAVRRGRANRTAEKAGSTARGNVRPLRPDT
jgi:hypothetical protein